MFGQNTNNTFSRFGQQNLGTQGSQQTSTGSGTLFGSGTGVFGGSGFGQGTTFGSGNSVFGQGTQLSSTSNFSFGGSKDTTGFNTQTTNEFNSQAVSTPSRGGIFGQNSTPTGFGNTYGSNTFTGNSLNSRIPTQGTSNPPYQVTQEKETSTGGMQYFQSITCMPAYQAASFEELRLQDYTQNRRFGQQQGLFGSFSSGQTTGNIFGSGNQTYTSQPFGLSSGINMFSNTQNISSPFGQTQQNQSKPFGFGTSNTFDTTKNQTTGVFSFGNSGNSTQSAFGSSSLFRTGFNNTQNEDNKTTTFGTANMGFGQNTTNTFGSGFGTNNTGTNIFGSNQQQSTSTPFGQTSTTQNTNSFTFGGNTNTTNNPSTGGMLFGNQVQQPSTSFGQSLTQNTSSFNFGTPNTTNTTTNSVGFSFGQQDNQQNKPALSFSSNLFGQNNQNQNQNKPTFSFGNNAGFGQSTVGTGLFGTNNTNTNSSTGLFGSNTTPASNTNTSFFGNQQSSGNLFGAKPVTNTGTSLFGNNPTLQSNTNAGGGLFGNTSGQSLFKNNNQQLGNSLLGNTQQQQQPLLHASIDKNPFGNNPLFQSSSISFPTNSPGPIATPLVTNLQKKKPAMLPHFKLTPGSSSSGKFQDIKGVSFSNINSPTIISATSHSLHLFDNLNDETMLNANAFSPRSNIKKLVINRKTSQTNILTGGADLGSFEKNLLKDTDCDKQNNKSSTKQSNGMVERVPDQESPTLIAAKHQNNTKTDATSNVLHDSTEEDKRESNSLFYWTSPSISKLLDYTTDELKHVSNFKVGRKGFGQISFQSPVDLTTFEALEDIPGTIIIFDEKVCTVYPDESLKPPLGCGINVPAIITLERCWPFSKEKREPITDPNHSRFQQHLDRLKRMKETEFIDYIADTGAWIFKVNHFSRWGLLEDDDSSSEKKDQDELPKSQEIKDQYTNAPFYQKTLSSNKELKSLTKQTYVEQKKGKLEQHCELSTNNESFQENMDLNKKYADLKNKFAFQHPTSKIPGSFILENSSEIMNYTIENNTEVDISRDETESCDYLSFDDTDNYSNLQTINDIVDTSSIDLKNKESELYFEDDSKGITSSKKRDNSDDESLEILSLSSKLPFLQDIKTWPDLLNLSIERFNLLHAPQTRTKKYRDPSSLQFDSPFDNFEPVEKYELQDLDRDLYDVQQTLHLPVHTSKSNSVTTIIPGKFHWGLNNILIIPLNNKNAQPKILLKKIDNQESILDNTQLALEMQLKHTNIQIDEYGCPEANPNSTLTSKLFIPFFDNYEANILQLCGILFDKIDVYSHNLQSESQKAQILRMQRKQNLSDWLKDIVATNVENDLYKSVDPSSKMFLLLTGYQIEECCLEALKSRNFFLASLIPLIGGDELIREDCKKQIADWKDSNCLPSIGKYYRAIYELMSGNTETSQGSGMKDSEEYAPDIHISEELDWKRAFGLKLWYELTDEMPIEVAVLSYQRAFNESSTVSSPEITYSKNTNNSDTQEFDILYHLLLLFSKDDYPLENIIDSLTLNFPLNFKIPWLLYIILSRTYNIRHFQDYTSFSSKKLQENKTTIRGNQLTLNFASQLESSGLWHWAIFVLQHLQYAHIRERAIREILARNIADYYNNKKNDLDTFLMQNLKIPKIWILESCALYSRYMNYYQSEEKYLLDAKLWNEAHKTLLTFIAPQAVIYSQHDVLYAFLQRFQNTSVITDWKIGGQIYLDYIELLKFNEKSKSLSFIKNNDFEITQTQKDLVLRLLQTLPIMDAKIFEQSVAIKIMSSFSASFILSNNIMVNEHSRILQMNLTEDEYFNKIKQLSLEYYRCINTAL
ncbi:hypothetical protein PNEG_01724 [Pneumocystis murina B123]|uniref:Peptidase S59 domain-containing protein n=1 Tax=Pneumocystis murina (strain B123) TaxID=1069680 RepID=M7NS72_PNEMU|nr:hypothetical protein PNEG_01724 [Pneumocystis murina B123]EMR09966.1 hypothetical protein PNEG_01724 [Pneumocystis murina B123]